MALVRRTCVAQRGDTIGTSVACPRVLHLSSASVYLIELEALRKLAQARVINDEMRDAWGEAERTNWPTAV